MTILPEMAIKGFLVLAAAAGVSFALRRRAAATRHLVWSLAVLTVLALPALIAIGPRRAVGIDDGSPLALLATRAPAATSGEPAGAASADRAGDVADGDARIDDQSGAAGDPREGVRPSARRYPSEAGEQETGAANDQTAAGTGGAGRRSGAGAVPAAEGTTRWQSDIPIGSDTAVSPGADSVVPATRITARSAAGSVATGFWIAGLAAILGLLLLERVQLARIARRAEPCSQQPVAQAFERLCLETGVRPRPRLLVGDDAVMPMTWGTIRPIVLLPASALRWPARRLDAVLRHEIAHAQRRDDLLQLAATLVAALHWFDPLAWLAVRRMRVEREHASDDAVLRAGARPSAYAEDLIGIADGYRTPVAAVLAAQSMARPSQLGERLSAVLEESRDRRRLATRAVVLSAVATFALALPLASVAVVATPVVTPMGPRGGDGSGSLERNAFSPAPGESGPVLESFSAPQTESTAPAAGGQQPVSECWSPGVERDMRSMSHSDDDLRVLEWESSGCRGEIRLRGELLFNDELTSVIGVSPGSSFRLEIDEDGVERRLQITAAADGSAAYTWLVDGRERPFDDDARRWFDALLPQIFRATGIAAEERTAAIFRAQGADGVFREIDLIASDSSTGRYLIALSLQPGLQSGDRERILRTVGTGIDSDSVRARVLEAIGTRYRDEVLRGNLDSAYWQAVRGMGSTSTKARLLGRLIEGEPQDSPMVTRVLEEAATGIESNSTLANFLRRLQRRYPDIATSGPQAALFWDTVARIESNSTTKSFLLDVGEGEPADSSVLPVIFRVARERITSSSTLADFVRTMERRYPGIGATGSMVDDFWSTVDQIESGSTMSDLLLDLAAGKASASPMLDRVLAAADHRITSSSQRRQFIVSFAGEHREAAAGRLSDEVLAFARGIDSDSARERTLRVLREMGIG